MKILQNLPLAVLFLLLWGCASGREMVITVPPALPDNAIAEIGARFFSAETLCSLIEEEKAEASARGQGVEIVLDIDPQASYSALENVLDCCGAKEIEKVTIKTAGLSHAVRIRDQKSEMKEQYISVVLAMPDGTGEIVAVIREVTPGAVGTDQALSIVQEFDGMRQTLVRARERLVKQKVKNYLAVIESRPDVTVSKVITVLTICERLGLTPEFIAPKW